MCPIDMYLLAFVHNSSSHVLYCTRCKSQASHAQATWDTYFQQPSRQVRKCAERCVGYLTSHFPIAACETLSGHQVAKLINLQLADRNTQAAMKQVIYGLTVLYFLGLMGVAQAQTQEIVSEVIRGSIFRYPTHVSVDQYTLRITTATALVEFDILSMETIDNTTFSDVNGDCDSAFIDSHLYLFRRETNGALTLLAYNDDEADDNSNYYGKGRRDGSLSTQDSYMIRRLATGTYMLAVGRYPLSSTSARAGKSTESINDFSPYACQMGLASYGNYQLTVRVQSTSSRGIVTKYPNSYVGSSCASAINGVTKQCTYGLPGNFASSIRSVCSYDNTV